MIKLDVTDKTTSARILAETVLKELNCFKEEERKKSKEIYQYAKSKKIFENLEEVFPAEDSLGAYLSFAKASGNSLIVKPAGKQGYYLSKTQEEIIKREEIIQKEDFKEKKERDKEKILYPMLSNWLKTQGYRAKDTSQSKSLGKWSNPDVSGIKISDFLGTQELEITTIEAKISIEQWEYNIFEAISHRRFANRVYFAFAHPYSLVNSLPTSLRYYCELYNIGLLLVTMEDDLYDKYLNGKISSLTSDDDFDITEYFSAPYTKVPIFWQKEFCTALGIKDIGSLYSWGDTAI